MRRRAHGDFARAGGQGEGALGCGALVEADRLGAAVGHDLAVDAGDLDHRVANGTQQHGGRGAVVVGCVGHRGVAHQGLGGVTPEGAAGWAAGEVVAQHVRQVGLGDAGLKVFVFTACEIRKCAVFGGGAGDAHVLNQLTGLAFVVEQHQGAADGGRRGAGAVHDLQGALPGYVVFKQVAVPLGSFDQIVGNGQGNLGAARKQIALGQGDRHIGISGRAREDDVCAHERVGGGCEHTHVHLPNGHVTASAGGFGHIAKHCIAAAVGDDGTGGASAAFGHIVHDAAGQQLDVAFKNGHRVSDFQKSKGGSVQQFRFNLPIHHSHDLAVLNLPHRLRGEAAFGMVKKNLVNGSS